MCMCTCYRTDKIERSGLYTCVCVYVHVTGLTRQRDKTYIGCVCAYIYVIGLTRQGDEGYIGCVYVYVHVIGLTS